MATNEERVRGLIAQDAADWFIANRAGLGARERQSFAAWLKASPVHVEEYLAFAVIARDLRAVCRESPLSLEELFAWAREDTAAPVTSLWPRLAGGLSAAAARSWRTVAVAAVVGVVALAALLVLWRAGPAAHIGTTPEAAAVRFTTAPGEQATRRLPDGSLLHLNGGSLVILRFSEHERRVELASGEADFEVAHAPGRPFRVVAGAAETVAVGTQFDVRLEGTATVVTVLDGRVTVAPTAGSFPGGSPAEIPLAANQQLTVVPGEWPATPVAVDAERSTAWLHRQIAFDHEPLERVAGEFNRYSTRPIEIATPALRKLEISGQFSTDDTDAFVAFLRTLKHVRVDVTATRIVVSQN